MASRSKNPRGAFIRAPSPRLPASPSDSLASTDCPVPPPVPAAPQAATRRITTTGSPMLLGSNTKTLTLILLKIRAHAAPEIQTHTLRFNLNDIEFWMLHQIVLGMARAKDASFIRSLRLMDSPVQVEAFRRELLKTVRAARGMMEHTEGAGVLAKKLREKVAGATDGWGSGLEVTVELEA